MEFRLRKWRTADAGDLAAVLSGREIVNNLRDGMPYPYTSQDAEDYITAMLSADEKSSFAYAIVSGDRVIGSIGVFRRDNIHSRTGELGYYLAEDCWGQGIMTEAIRRICRMVFAETDILRIYAEPFAYNTGSRRALEKAGFVYEGTMKNNAVKNGKVMDMCLYALTRGTSPVTVKRLAPEQFDEALSLVWEVFCRFEAPEYSEEGIAEFRGTLDDREKISRMALYGAYVDQELTGVLAMRSPQHISLFFVKEEYHCRGIGRLLFDEMRRDYDRQCFTVNSSPYAVPV
ncbi:MAG: GNAT family N-acetyltransferase, partial [Emergencia sp.]